MANSSAGDASISQLDLNQISISDASGPAVSPDASEMASLHPLELMMIQLEQQLRQLCADWVKDHTLWKADRAAFAARCASQNAPVPLELPQPPPVPPCSKGMEMVDPTISQPVLDQVENSPAPVDCDLAEACSASMSPEPSQALLSTITHRSGTVPDPIQSPPSPLEHPLPVFVGPLRTPTLTPRLPIWQAYTVGNISQ
ncbi:uncharacterized protein EI90DRAFT_3131367 [Cantharellus anzutake]|uniref:uncharacterized protein n=1 Tax=Cantharellus anzutake TaxID=1750568 RepID=UPI001908D14B|nr:uncharacterized protein EI90DRAFT_3131367 [Cantharellus anzutake]KAF8321929.1 hypothetical protein EI90DRAFT_3131367 [Cantharellus anzutake]